MYKFRDGNLCKIFHIFLLTNCVGSGIIKIRRARTVRAARKKIKKRVEISPHYFDELELLKKPPMKLNRSTTPKACQKVNANAILNKLSTQFASNMKIHPSKQRIPNTNAITIITANNVLILYISLSFIILLLYHYLFYLSRGNFLFLHSWHC